MILLGRLPFRYGAPPPPPQTQHAGFRSVPGKWVGGFGAPPPPSNAGYRSVFGRWVGGFGAPPAAAGPAPAGYRSVFGRWVGGLNAPKAVVAKKQVGWMPEWRFRHDPEDLERRLKAQRESVFNPQWLDRFLVAEEKARVRIGKVKSATHRAALEEAVEQVAARIGEAIDAGYGAPEELIIALEAAASATRLSASLKHALRAIEMAHAILMEEEDIEILLLH